MTGCLREIRGLAPVRDHQRIVFLTARCDFPFDMTRALEFALFRTFAIPSVAQLLDRTGEFRQRTQRRYDDTDIIVSELMEHGYESERGRGAIERMNAIHGRFRISNADYLYVLSCFIFEPIRWMDRFGWRRMIEAERLALYYFWKEVGIRMGIREIPESIDEFEALNRSYEAARFAHTEAGERTAKATIGLFASWAPWPISLLVPPVMHAVVGAELREMLGLPTPPAFLEVWAPRLLRWRGWLEQAVSLWRGPVLRSELERPSYPEGYTMEGIGPDRR